MVPMSLSRASSLLASNISSINWSSSAMLRAISAVNAGDALGPSSSSPMRMRVSGERSSCEALANSDFCDASSDSCDCTSVCTRCAAWLKRRARKATSSRPSSLTRADRSPSPQRCTPSCRRSRRRVSVRTMGYVASATAIPTHTSIQAKPNGGRLQKDAGARMKRMCMVLPSCMRTMNSGAGGRSTSASACEVAVCGASSARASGGRCWPPGPRG